MRPSFSNQPLNLPRRRREPALKTLIVMLAVIALMFGIRIFCEPNDELQVTSDKLQVTGDRLQVTGGLILN